MIKVFAPPAPIDTFSDWFGKSSDFSKSENFGEVLVQDIKIACVPIFFDEGYKFPYDKFDLILISDIEFNHVRVIQEWVKKLQIKNYLIAVGGLEKYTVLGDYIYRPWWAFNLVNRNTHKKINTWNPLYNFDVLLGARKPHRDFVMAKCQKSFLLDSSIVNYRQVFKTPEYIDPDIQHYITSKLYPDQLLFPYISHNLDPKWEVAKTVNYQVSDQVPWNIYEHTKFSAVLETHYHEVFFFSEKPAKALLGRRVFVVFSCQHYLEQMRTLFGFKTFDGIINEGYDLEENAIKRFEMAFEQMEWLARQDYTAIKLKTDPIVDYNFNRLLELKQEIADQMLQMVYNKIEEIKC